MANGFLCLLNSTKRKFRSCLAENNKLTLTFEQREKHPPIVLQRFHENSGASAAFVHLAKTTVVRTDS